MSLAKVILSGEVISAPEKRFTPNNNVAVANFVISVTSMRGAQGNAPSEPFQVKVNCWRGLADTVAEQLQVGDHVIVEGKLIMNQFQTAEGVQKRMFEVEAASLDKVSDMQPLLVAAGAGGGEMSTRSASGSSASQSYASSPRPAAATAPSSQFQGPSSDEFSPDDLLTEDDIPF